MSTATDGRARAPVALDEAAVRAGVRVSLPSLLALRHLADRLPLKSVRVRAREGGALRSPFRGRGMEFEESRPYQPGDDLRSLDWRVTARTGKPFTKLFREERERPVLLCVDYRCGMFFATRGSFKAVIAARAAAMLGWSALRHGDRLGGLIFSERHHEELRPQRGKVPVLHFIDGLVDHPAWSESGSEVDAQASALVTALARLRRVARPGSLVFLLSDFRALDAGAEGHLARLAGHSDVVMLLIHDPIERELPPAGLYPVRDARERLTLDTRDPARCRDYSERFQMRLAALRSLARRYRIHLALCSTADDTLATLRQGLGLNAHGKHRKR